MIQAYYPNNIYHLGILMIGIGIAIRYLSGSILMDLDISLQSLKEIDIIGKKVMNIQEDLYNIRLFIYYMFFS
ncbi:hypothetical protein Q5M85_20205 [Paraclostridium bifermentans]|nr:hypothetical protein [Paraclostridium bifermentans]